MPGTRFAFLDTPGPIAFAHRGGSVGGLENTMAAFAAAVALGYRYVETDVHLTADGVLVAFHDDDLGRVSDRTGRVHELPWREVAAARIAGRERVPTFDELLGAWPGLRINVEPKSDAAVEPLCEAIRRAGAIDRVCIGSFSDARVERARALLGERLCTSPGQRAVAALWAAAQTGVTARARARLSRLLGGAGCVQIPTRHRRVPVTTRRMVAACHALGLDVHVWTVDDPAEMTRLLDLGVDGLMTDQPAVLKSVLERRGQWTA